MKFVSLYQILFESKTVLRSAPKCSEVTKLITI